MSQNKVDFNSYLDLQNYVERRIILDPELFSRNFDTVLKFMHTHINDIYDLTGKFLFSLDERVYWTDDRDKRHVITSMEGLKKARGNIYHYSGRVAMLNRDLVEKNYMTQEPGFIRALKLSEILIADMASGLYERISISRDFPSIENSIKFDELYGRDHEEVKVELSSAQRQIQSYLENLIDRNTWKELFLEKRNGVLVLDVGMDIRIKEWYLDKFAKRDAAEQERQEHIESERIRNGFY